VALQQRSTALLAGSDLNYDSMKLTQLRACCGQKHGNSIKDAKKDNKGQWTKKLKEELISDFKNAAMLRSRIGGSKKGFAALFSKQTSAASCTDNVLASSSAMSLPGVAQPLVGSEVSVANPAIAMNSTVATPNSMRKPASFEPASGAGMALDGKRNLNWYWSLTASSASLVGWNGPLTEEQIDHWEFLIAQGIAASRVTLAEDKNKFRASPGVSYCTMSLTCGPFAKRHFKSMTAKKTVVQTSRSQGD